MNSLVRIAEVLRVHRFDDSSYADEIFCHEVDDSVMVGLKRGLNAQSDWEEWVEHITPVLAAALELRCEQRMSSPESGIHICRARVGHEGKHSCVCYVEWDAS